MSRSRHPVHGIFVLGPFPVTSYPNSRSTPRNERGKHVSDFDGSSDQGKWTPLPPPGQEFAYPLPTDEEVFNLSQLSLGDLQSVRSCELEIATFIHIMCFDCMYRTAEGTTPAVSLSNRTKVLF